MKVCTKCKETKSFEEFHRDRNSKDGREYRCKKCRNEYHQNNKERIAERGKKYRENNKEKYLEGCRKYRQNNKERVAKYAREYYQANREKIAEKNRKYRQNNKEKCAEYGREYRKNNPFQIQSITLSNSARQRTKKNKIAIDLDFISPSNIMDWLKRQPNCVCCGRVFRIGYKGKSGFHDDSPSLDRFYPKLGYVLGNVFLICWRCNELKNNTTVKELETVVAWMKQNHI